MRLDQIGGPMIYAKLAELRPPSYGLPIVPSPPPKQGDLGVKAVNSTASASLARTSGLPGSDRAPEWDDESGEMMEAEREQPQGTPKPAHRPQGMEGGF